MDKIIGFNGSKSHIWSRVARSFIFKPKIQIWVNFGGSCNGRFCYIYILWHLANFPTIRYILLHYGIFYGHLIYFPRFGILCHEKSGKPDLEPIQRS
jgi:hypothetical protein